MNGIAGLARNRALLLAAAAALGAHSAWAAPGAPFSLPHDATTPLLAVISSGASARPFDPGAPAPRFAAGVDFETVGATRAASPAVTMLAPGAAPSTSGQPAQPAPAEPTPAAAAPSIEPPLPADIATPAGADAPDLIAPPEFPAPVAPVPSPLQLAIEASLGRFAARDDKVNPLGAGDWRAAKAAIRAVYAARSFTPIWVEASGLSPTGRAALARLQRARVDGLDLAAFDLPKTLGAGLSADQLAEAETTIAAAVVAYAEQASGARVAPTRISRLITARPEVADPSRALLAVAAADDPGAALAAFNPPQKPYRLLRDELATLDAASGPPAARLPQGPALRLGMIDARVPLIRARLGLDIGDPAEADRFDARVASAVAAFQRVNGLAANGVVTAATGRALEADPNARKREAILANMEMWRWQPRDLGDRRIEVNVPDYTLTMSSGGDVVHRARVIVGKPDTPTPIFSNAVKYITVNPVWRVPDSIIKKEMMPKLANDPDYLTRHGFKVTKVGERLVVQQPPGDGNALGHILFMFPNEHSVYLHDTPLRGLFASERRAFSHGCVRVEKPFELAELVMGGPDQSWTARRFAVMIGRSEAGVPLPQAVPIHIEYFTEFVDEYGALQEREDIYGITRRVADTLSRRSQD